jgi:RNA polymerase sigma factor (sigma-70 family)
MRTTLRGPFSGTFLHQLDRLFHHGTAIGATEGELLDRFIRSQDEAAFEALMARHGPMVLGICRRLLRDPNDVDDAFQATFLVLVRKAGTLRRRDLLGNWLYGVAHRVATRSRCLAAKRMTRAPHGQETIDRLDADENGAVAVSDPAPGLDAEPGPWLNEEVRRLPEKYRAPVVLCYLEGLTHEEAAARLGWPIGTVKGRLARARDLLRRRLDRRGVTLSAAALDAHLALPDGLIVPESLKTATLKAARAVADAAGASLLEASTVSLPVAALVDGVSRAMITTTMKAVSVSVLVAGAVTTGLVLAAAQGPARKDKPAGPPEGISKEYFKAEMAKTKGQDPALRKSDAVEKKSLDAAGEPSQKIGQGGMMRMNQMAGMMRAQMAGRQSPAADEFKDTLEIAVLDAALAEFAEGADVGGGAVGEESLRKRLEKPLTMSFANPTPLAEVLKYIKAATARSDGKPIPIYVDPKALQLVGVTMDSPVTIDLDGVPLKMSLRLMLKQLDLAYCVRDGVLIISTVKGIREELAEAAAAAFGSNGQQVDEVMQSLGIRTNRGIQ